MVLLDKNNGLSSHTLIEWWNSSHQHIKPLTLNSNELPVDIYCRQYRKQSDTESLHWLSAPDSHDWEIERSGERVSKTPIIYESAKSF